MSQSQSVSEFFKSGKMDADFEVKDGYVTGLCVLYAERTAKEQEYMIREKSIVMLEGRDLSGCVQEAKDLACRSALRRLSDMPPVTGVEPQGKQKPKATAEAAPQKSAAAPPVVREPELEELPGPKQEPAEQPPSFTGTPNPEETPESEDEPITSGATQVGFADLRPASSLLKPEPQPASGPEPDDADEAYEKAYNMKITILGKLHECCGWTAGQILEKHPEVILEFANRYNGPKTEEKEALRTLYTEAMRRVSRAA